MSFHGSSTAITVRGQPFYENVQKSSELRYQAKKAKKCANCGAKLSGRRSVYCSDKCSTEFSLRYYGHSWEVIRKQVLERDGHKCRVCGRVDVPDKWGSCACEVDHIVEVDRGGDDRPENLQTLCSWHHFVKTRAYIRKKHYRPPVPAFLVDPVAALSPPAFVPLEAWV